MASYNLGTRWPKGITIYDLPALVAFACTSAVTPSNIQAGFKSTEIYPFNSQIFSDSDFFPGCVTNHLFSLPATGEAETTSNKTPKTLLEYQLAENDDRQENNKIAKSTAVDTEQPPSKSSEPLLNKDRQR